MVTEQTEGTEGTAESQDELAMLEVLVSGAAKEIEDRLAGTLGRAIEGINAKIELNATAAADIQAKAKIAFEAVPNLIQEKIEAQLRDNLKGIVEEVGNQFEAKMKAAGGGAGADGALFDKLLSNSDKIIGAITAIRSPTTEQAMMGEMDRIYRWHGLLSKLEKGGGSGEEVTKAIASTFATKKPE